MEKLSGQSVLGRPVKVGPGKAGRSKYRQRPSDFTPRCRNQAYSWSSIQSSNRADRPDQREPSFQRWKRLDASDHWEGYSEEGCRLWVGGLPKTADHASMNLGVRKLFEGLNIEAVSKVIIPRNPGFGHPDAWGHRYLFVDFPSAEEARRAAGTTNGRRAWGVQVRVDVAKPVTAGKALEAKRLLEH